LRESFAQEQDVPKSFLLLNGHHTRFEIPFLDSIHDAWHDWVVCIGVPYGMHIWQVANSSEMNGAFKLSGLMANKEYFNAKPRCKSTTTDVPAIINHA
jgi:hypothetical protein